MSVAVPPTVTIAAVPFVIAVFSDPLVGMSAISRAARICICAQPRFVTSSEVAGTERPPSPAAARSRRPVRARAGQPATRRDHRHRGSAEGRDGGRDERLQGALTGLCRCDLARPTSEPTGAAARLLKLLRSEAGHERIVRLEVRELGRFSTSVATLVPPVVIGREKSVCLALPPQLSDGRAISFGSRSVARRPSCMWNGGRSYVGIH